MPHKLSKKALDALECALDLLNTPKTWTKGSWATTRDGVPVAILSPEAKRFCVMGAIDRCYGVESDGRLPITLHGALHNTAKELYPELGGLIAVNDGSKNSRRVKRVLRTILKRNGRKV